MTSRLFISLDLPENVVNKLVDLRNNKVNHLNNFRWEHDEKLHITLKFLGDVGENVTELLIRRFEEIKFDKFVCKFKNFSFFGKNGIPKILHADFEKNDKIINFHEIIDSECEFLGFNKEKRKFKPHVTLLRIKEDTNITQLKDFSNSPIGIESFEVETFSIVKSELNYEGSVYTKIKSFKLL
jgi:2'-5' RNA ligase